MPKGVSQWSRRRIPITAELLSAYLDDQVTPDERAAVEQAIAEDPTVAEQVRALSQTVALLRALPRASVPRAFTLSEADVATAHTPWWERNWRRLAFAFYLRGAALVAAALLVVVVLADLRQGQLLPTMIGAQGELTTVVARGELPASTIAVAAEGAQPAPLESLTPGETDLAAASPPPEVVVPEAALAEEAPTEEAELPTSAMEPSPTVEIEPPALAVRPPAEKAESPAPTAELSPTALPLPTEATPSAEEPAEEGPLAAAPTMGGGLLEPLDQEGAGPVARGGGPPGAPGLGGAGGMGGAESPSDRRPSVFGFAPPPVDGGLPAVPVLETAEASAGPAVEALAMPTAAAVAAAAAAPEAPAVELPAEGAGVPTEPVAAPAAEALVVESPAEEAPAALARAAAPEAAAASATPTREPSVMEAPTVTPTPSPTLTIVPSPTAEPTMRPVAEESLAAEAPTATLAPSPTPTISSSPTAFPELPTPATPSESPTPPASPSPVPSPAATVQGEATASAGQQGGRAEIGLRFGPWTLAPGQVRALEVVLGASVVVLLAASWLVRRR